LTRVLDLRLPDIERRRAAALATEWSDLLYVPGRGFASPIDPGVYRSTFVIVPAGGSALRVSSLTVPAFGGEVCRLRLEALTSFRRETLGSFFEPGRRGVVYALSLDRTERSAGPADRPGWSYDGPSLAPRLRRVERVRLIRERVTGGGDDRAFSWVADRGLAIAGADGGEGLFLASPDTSEDAAFAAAPGLYRALVDASAPETPGAAVTELLGYGDWRGPLRVVVEIEPL
jgi:hypothetical protein